MRGPKPIQIELSAAERAELEQLVRRHTTPQQIALRARIVLAAASGANNCQIARQEGMNVDTVRLWRQRWLICAAASLDDLPVLDRLSDAPRSGKPASAMNRSATFLNSLVKRLNALVVQLATGVSARSPMKSKHAGLSSRFLDATQPGCSKGGSPAAALALLVDPLQ